jgi:hypothetical protein
MRIFSGAVKGKLGITRFNGGTFGVLASRTDGSGAQAPIRRLPPLGAVLSTAEPRHGATMVQFAGFGV